MSDKKKHKNPETPPAAADAELEAENDREEASEPPKKEAKIPEVITPREKTPEEVVAAYEADDVVIFRDTDGSWKEAKLTANPQAVRSGGKVKYKFNIEGKSEAIISTTPLRKVEGLSLVRDLSAKGSVELNGKEYELSVPLNDSGELVLGAQGEEEYLLQEVGKSKGQRESRYIDVETVKSIYEAKQAKERFDKDLHELQDKVEQLQGIKTKELYTRLGSLKKDVERITKLMDFNIANSEDADAKELQKINTRIEQLTEKIENAVRDLNKDIRVQGKTAAAREANEVTSGTEKGKVKDRQKIVAEVGEEIEESLSAADWRHEHENGAAKKKYDKEVKEWEDRNKAARLWDDNKRKNIRNPGPRPNPGSRPQPNVGEKPSESKEIKGKLVYDIYKKRPDTDPYVQAVKAAVAKKIERVVGRKVDMAKLDEEVLQLVGSDVEAARAFKKEEAEFNKKKEALDAKMAHNAPLELQLQELQQEEQKFKQELEGIDAKAGEYDVHAEQEAVARKESNKKRIELNNLQPKTLDPARVKELRDQRDLQEQLLGTVKKDKEKKKIEARIQAIDNELATQNIDAERVRLQKEIDDLESIAFAAQSAKEAIDKELGAMGSRKQEIGVELLRIAAEQKNANDEIQKITQGEKDEVNQQKQKELKDKKDALVTSTAQERAEMYIGQIAEQVLESWKKEVQGKPGAESAEARKNFDYAAEHDQLTKQTTTLKTKITQVPNRTQQKKFKEDLRLIENRISELDEDAPDIEKSMLALWKDVGELEVSIDNKMPLGSNEQEEAEVREVREAREKRVVTRELPSYMINELLDSRKIQFGEIVKMIYEEKLVTTTEQGVEVIQANENITRLMKGLFLAEMPPSDQTLDMLRQYGIRDWKTFKELWDNQYASHIGMMLQEDAQNTIDQRVRNERIRLDNRSWWERKIKDRSNPTDDEIKAKVLENIFEQDTVAGISVSDEGLAFYSRIMGTAMREINLELKMSVADNDQQRAEILKSFGRKADDYVVYNGQYFIKNEEHRMIRKENSNDIDTVIPDHEERTELISEIDDRIEASAGFLQEWRFGSISPEDQTKLAEHITYFKNVLGAAGDKGDKTAVVLAHNLILQDQVKDLVYEYDRMRERKGVKVFERVARTVSKRGEEIVAKDKAEGGVVHKIVETKEKIPVPEGKKSSKLKKMAIAAVLAVGGVSGYYAVHHYHPGWGSSVGGPQAGAQRDRASGGERAVGVELGKVRDGVTDVEMRIGNPEKERATTTSVEWNLSKITTFEEAIKKVFNNKKSQGEIFAASSSVKDVVFGIADTKDRAAAIRGVYYLGANISQENSVDSMEQLRDIIGTSNAQEAAKKLVAVGNKVDSKSPYLMEAKDTRPVDKMVQQTKNAPTDPSDPGSPAFQEIIKNSSFSKVDKLRPNVMRWAPLVLEEYLKVYPTYSSGAQRKDVKERLEGILFDVSSTLARIGTESDGKTRDVHPTSNAMGLTQIVDSTVRSHCPGADLSDPGQQIACGMAEALNKSNKYKGDAYIMHVAYGSKQYVPKELNELVGSKGREDGIKAFEAKYSNIAAYTRKNINLPKPLIQDHKWFNELLKDPKFKFLWEDLKQPLPEFGLTPQNPERVAQNSTAAEVPKVESKTTPAPAPEKAPAKAEAAKAPNEFISTAKLVELRDNTNDPNIRLGVTQFLEKGSMQATKDMMTLLESDPEEAKKRLAEMGKKT